ncbi:MAG: hypothetical protein K2W95_12135 [Candidatus Obscuribacterales bacterium]|nr:hypothetical protein [Candidatus Obscuribacterales bacterium]
MFIVGIDSGATAQNCGNKGHSLVQLSKAGFTVPEWIALSPSAFAASLSERECAIFRQLCVENDSAVRLSLTESLFNTFSLSDQIQHQLEQSLRLLGDCQYYAVRSSSLEEDGVEQSYAGLFESFLHVPDKLLLTRVKEVWRSAFAERVAVYHRQNGNGGVLSVPAVIIQKMVAADVAGVAFSVDPVSGNSNVCIVESVYGLGEGLVGGQADADSWSVDMAGTVLRERLALKSQKVALDPASNHGTRLVDVTENDRAIASLSREELSAIASCARRVQSHFGRPMDIEWCIANGVIYLVQARPITALHPMPVGCGRSPSACVDDDLCSRKLAPFEGAVAQGEPAPCGAEAAPFPGDRASRPVLPQQKSLSVREMNVWDSSNISESYPGVTTPLTFTFAKKAYEHVYREFLKLMGVGPRVIDRYSNVYPCMLGLVRGRMYYNLPSWFKLLSLLPGFGSNASHMETMMGLKEPLPEALMRQIKTDVEGSRPGAFGMLTAVFRLTLNLVSLRRSVADFEHRVNEALADLNHTKQLDGKSVLELGLYYRLLESRLLKKWDAPIVNDFFAMIFYGVLRKLCTAWLGDKDGSLQNQLISRQSGIISAEPARLIVRMAQLAAPFENLVSLLCQGTPDAARAEINKYPALALQLNGYLEQFGDRCLEELKLETPTLNDSPEMLFRSIGQLARSGATASHKMSAELAESTTAHQSLGGLNPVRRVLFDFVLAQTKERIRQRENLRFLRTRVFGRVRRVFLAIGRKLAAAGVIGDERDIFYLEVEEVLAYAEGTTTCAKLGDIAAIRKAEFAHYQELAEPPVRITTMGIPSLSADVMTLTTPVEVVSAVDVSSRLSGTPCSPGRVLGRVRVITDPAQAKLEKGDIIVARRTDPGWILLFPIAAGLIVEHGSLLSHSAIVSRELGLPAIVGVCNATHLLKDGDVIEFDGRTGDIEVVERKESTYVSA